MLVSEVYMISSARQNWFTLVELIITIVILSILSTLGLISFTGYSSQARDATRGSDIKNISTILNLTNSQNLSYPNPTDAVDITYSWATLWSQWVFGPKTAFETGKIFWELRDPLYKNYYSYSVTSNRKEYQLWVLFEQESDTANFLSFQWVTPHLISQVYANDPFDPLELNPIIWLDALDIDGDGDTTDNPWNGNTISDWKNKSSAGSVNDPTLSWGSFQYATTWYDGSYPAIYIDDDTGLKLNNSDITQWDIFQVIQNRDPFWSHTDNNGRGLQWTTGNYLIWYHGRRRHALYINGSPSHFNRSPASVSGRTNFAFTYGFHTDGTNYEFYDTGAPISQWSTNSISGIEWWYNRAWNYNEKAEFVVSEILIFDTKLSSTDRQRVEWYLAHKWWQTQWLPPSHPYKTEPPISTWPPPTPDTTPDIFILSDVTNADIFTQYDSNPVLISGINTPTNISISWWLYSINGGNFTNTSWNISNGDSVIVRLISSNENNTATTASLNIWGVIDDYTVTTLIADITPDQFTFDSVIDADISAAYSSNSVVISWLNTPTEISISGGWAEYKISDGIPYDVSWSWTASASHNYPNYEAFKAFDNQTWISGWWNTGTLPSRLNYDLGNGGAKTVTKYTLFRWNSWWFSCNSPKNWTFEASNNGSNWIVLDSRSNEYIFANATKKEYSISNSGLYRYYRLNISASQCSSNNWVNITEMELIDEQGSWVFTSETGSVVNGDIVSMKMLSSSIASDIKTWSLTVGTFTTDYQITTVDPDTTPDSFSFIDEVDVELWSVQTSNTVTIWGINTSASISISGDSWEYSVNGGAFISTPWNIDDGDTVRLRLIASNSNSETRSTTLTIGWVNATYNVSTPAPPPDTTPDSFTFVDTLDALTWQVYVSNTITISGINTATSVSITWWEYSVNGTNTFTSSSWTLDNGDTISVRSTSSSNPWTTVDVIVTIWWVSDTYSITTIDPDTSPESFAISDITDAVVSTTYDSNAFEIQGINTQTDISISWGWASYSINGWSFTRSSWTLNNGDSVTVRMNSSDIWEGTSLTSVTIGWVSDTFQITNGVGDTVPDAFVFNNILDAPLNSQHTSNTITITGLTAPADISISWGEYRIWSSGSFTSEVGTIENNQTLTLRLVSSINGSTTSQAEVNISGEQWIYQVTTLAYTPPISNISSVPQSKVYLIWEYNGLITHAKNEDVYYIVASPSIMTYDTTDTDFVSIVENKKLVYSGYENIPASYAGNDLVMNGGFDFTVRNPLLYSGSKEDLGSYGGLSLVDEWVRTSYADFTNYRDVASYLDNRSLNYLEDIVWDVIGINPIRPFYCSDILQSKLITNIAQNATISATPNTIYGWYGISWIANGVTSTEWDLDFEYHSDTPNAFIHFDWESPQAIWFLRIYNRTGCCSERLSWATIKLFNESGGLIYSHPLWDTTWDYVIDLDLEWIGHLHQVSGLTIETVWENFLNIREVEIYLWGNIKSWEYKVDRDGLGWQSPYNVYCDMETDGGGWTRIGNNYVHNGDFSWGSDIEEYVGNANLGVNIIKSPLAVTPPANLPWAFILEHNGWIRDAYNLEFDSVPWDFFAQEIRLSWWVQGTNSSVFENTISYEDGRVITTRPDPEILDSEDGGWELHRVRIPLDGLVESFSWNVAGSVAGPLYFTGLDMEVYYR